MVITLSSHSRIIVNTLLIDIFKKLLEYDFCSLHGFYFFGGHGRDRKASFSKIFWMSIIVVSLASASLVLWSNIQGFHIYLTTIFKLRILEEVHEVFHVFSSRILALVVNLRNEMVSCLYA